MKHSVALLVLAGFIVGCGSSLTVPVDNVQLSGSNYKMLKPGAKGVSTGLVILAIPLALPTYADAKADLYKSVKQDLSGRSIAIINQSADRGGPWLVLIAFPQITVTGDVIEFTGAPPTVINQK